MGMDYLPVYEGDEDDDSSVKVSAGKLQKAGCRSASHLTPTGFQR
jgi:Cu(I)/Ag(I) efflux system membrane fusion protein